MLKNFKEELNQTLRVGVYIKKKYGFDSIAEFEKYIASLQKKARKYDELIHQQDKLS